MYNLLSPTEKKHVNHEYRLRLVSVLLIFVLCTLIVALFFLYPSYVISKQKEDLAARNEVLFIKSVEVRDEGALNTIIAATKEKMKALQPDEESPTATEMIKTILQKRPNGIRLIQFTFTGVEEGPDVVLRGGAADRVTLRAFVRDLQTVALFETVRIPVSDYAKETNIEFSVEVTVKK